MKSGKMMFKAFCILRYLKNAIGNSMEKQTSDHRAWISWVCKPWLRCSHHLLVMWLRWMYNKYFSAWWMLRKNWKRKRQNMQRKLRTRLLCFIGLQKRREQWLRLDVVKSSWRWRRLPRNIVPRDLHRRSFLAVSDHKNWRWRGNRRQHFTLLCSNSFLLCANAVFIYLGS